MELLVFRHGIAEEGNGKPDAERPLTPRGVERTTQAARGLERVVAPPRALLSSPKLRARQTAGILAEVFGLEIEVADVLAEGPAPAVRDMLRGRRRDDRLAIVGHDPTLSQLVELYCTGQVANGGGFIQLKKAGAALLEGGISGADPPTPITLQWLLTPHVLRSLAG